MRLSCPLCDLIPALFFDIKSKNIYKISAACENINNIINKINTIEECPEDKAFLAGIIQMHSVECPNPNCIIKSKEPIYLPIDM